MPFFDDREYCLATIHQSVSGSPIELLHGKKIWNVGHVLALLDDSYYWLYRGP